MNVKDNFTFVSYTDVGSKMHVYAYLCVCVCVRKYCIDSKTV